jgi:hypothetical protein
VQHKIDLALLTDAGGKHKPLRTCCSAATAGWRIRDRWSSPSHPCGRAVAPLRGVPSYNILEKSVLSYILYVYQAVARAGLRQFSQRGPRTDRERVDMDTVDAGTIQLRVEWE